MKSTLKSPEFEHRDSSFRALRRLSLLLAQHLQNASWVPGAHLRPSATRQSETSYWFIRASVCCWTIPTCSATYDPQRHIIHREKLSPKGANRALWPTSWDLKSFLRSPVPGISASPTPGPPPAPSSACPLAHYTLLACERGFRSSHGPETRCFAGAVFGRAMQSEPQVRDSGVHP